MTVAITTINENTQAGLSRVDINSNFDNLNNGKLDSTMLDTDSTMTANSDAKIPSQKAVRALVESGGVLNASETVRGLTQEATDAQVTAGSSTGSTGAKLFVTPAKLATSRIYKSGVATRDLSASNGAVTYAHGLGKTPKKVVLTSIYSIAATRLYTSFGVWTPTETSCIATQMGSVIGNTSSTTNAIIMTVDNNPAFGAQQTGVVTVDATNITITWTKTGSPTGTYSFIWEAE